MPSPERFLATILSGDVAGYSRLMADNEIETIHSLNACRARIKQVIDRHQGRLVDFTGDNFMAEFRSAVAALTSAYEIQTTLNSDNVKLPAERKMRFRLGLHLGEILLQDGRIYGDGVNIAARLEAIATPGGICISENVYQQVAKKVSLKFSDLGAQTLKNISTPIRAYRVLVKDEGNANHGPFHPLREELQPPEQPSLAVLPFVNLSNDPGQDYFADGLTMDIMTALVKIPGLFVIGEGSTLTYRGVAVASSVLGKELGVRHLLEGGVQRSGGRVRVHAQLVESKNGRRIWAERYDRQMDDLFAIQDELTEKVVTALDVQLVSGEPARMFRSEFSNPEAIEACYRGWSALFRGTPEAVDDAQNYFERTIVLEPGSSVGYASAAWAYWWAASQGLTASADSKFGRADDLAKRAIELGDSTGLAHIVVAHLHLIRGEHDRALAAAERATLERPSCDAAFAAKANVMRYLDRSDEAIKLARQAIRITPLYPLIFPAILAAAYHGAERYEEAIVAAQAVLLRDPNHIDALVTLAASAAVLHRSSEAAAAVDRIRTTAPGFQAKQFAAQQPFREQRMRDRLLTQLKAAGLN